MNSNGKSRVNRHELDLLPVGDSSQVPKHGRLAAVREHFDQGALLDVRDDTSEFRQDIESQAPIPIAAASRRPGRCPGQQTRSGPTRWRGQKTSGRASSARCTGPCARSFRASGSCAGRPGRASSRSHGTYTAAGSPRSRRASHGSADPGTSPSSCRSIRPRPDSRAVLGYRPSQSRRIGW